jgi:CheY-like chemotaxis protein
MNTPYPTRAELGLKILLAEDTLATQRLLTHLLKRLGCEVQVAEHGQLALDLFDADPTSFDLVLMDMKMPVMDGFEATRRLRERYPDQPILALTALDQEMQQRCRDAGCNDFLLKPVDRQQLYDVLVKYSHPDGEFG